MFYGSQKGRFVTLKGLYTLGGSLNGMCNVYTRMAVV